MLRAYQDKLAGLKFLDPACGSGNFLTETYICLRRLENEVLNLLGGGTLDLFTWQQELSPVKVSISQFHGIEINDFAVSVAKTALWIAESQMLDETARIVGHHIDFLPLKTYTSIVEGNALRVDWNSVLPASECSYIMGNPPFLGARTMGADQKADLAEQWPDVKNIGNLDYVGGWYFKADEYTKGSDIRSALVSTNSISQGEQVAILWKKLAADGIVINFACRTFIWNNEAADKAHVHCVIIGFSRDKSSPKHIYDGDVMIETSHINGYLMDANDVFIESRSKPLCDVPEIWIGNKPIDGGNYLFTKDEMDEFIAKEPKSKPYFHNWLGAEEFLNGKERYCLWLGDCNPAELIKMPKCVERVRKVKEFRLASKSAGTRKIADKPTRFHVENMPKTNYIVIPEVSSERRPYIPMGYEDCTVLCSNLLKLIPDATVYHLGVLESSVHMSWMRAVAGRLKSDYRYSKDIVYNNFVWPDADEATKQKISKTAQGILDARAKYPEATLGQMYSNLDLFSDLQKAHKANDKAVLEAYGLKADTPEPEIEAHLFKLYEEKVREEQSATSDKTAG
ncbi:MAG: hypothetical protein PUA61_05615 [Succinatimonas hippei]|nr:hypothetical protein [Succinatimonas hippei]